MSLALAALAPCISFTCFSQILEKGKVFTWDYSPTSAEYPASLGLICRWPLPPVSLSLWDGRTCRSDVSADVGTIVPHRPSIQLLWALYVGDLYLLFGPASML
ncbi:hypothetical protein Ddye_012639 [Dipteronia dyeriana]|uniref:Uncharacterized protein n=1 Tax=Dipteronia dyeriana TaxID=168575 RepID=A0AAE0CJF7_9ROSI|nr:hypothetical protein Ddye_012639 [Dipteronia dyeriana]